MFMRDRTLKLFQSTTATLLFAIFLIYQAILTPFYFQQLFGPFNPSTLPSFLFLDSYTFFIFTLIPLSVGKWLLHQSPREYGVRAPENKWLTLTLTLTALLITLPITYFCAEYSSFKHYYATGPLHPAYFIFLQLVLFPCYYFSEELFFRGFLFLTLWRKVGWHSFWITDIIFTLAHLGKPPLEILLSIPASVLLNYLTLKSRSIYPAFFVHCLIGILLFTLVNT